MVAGVKGSKRCTSTLSPPASRAFASPPVSLSGPFRVADFGDLWHACSRLYQNQSLLVIVSVFFCFLQDPQDYLHSSCVFCDFQHVTLRKCIHCIFDTRMYFSLEKCILYGQVCLLSFFSRGRLENKLRKDQTRSNAWPKLLSKTCVKV